MSTKNLSKEVIFILLALAIVIVVAFFLLSNKNNSALNSQNTTNTTSTNNADADTLLPKASEWMPDAAWTAPQTVSQEETTYGKLAGQLITAKITDKNVKIGRNFENAVDLTSLGYAEDLSQAADGPGASNWGYKKTVNGMTQIVSFGYSSSAIFGPESKEPFSASLSVFVSDPFTEK